MRAISARYSSHDFLGNPNVLTWLLEAKRRRRSSNTFEHSTRRTRHGCPGLLASRGALAHHAGQLLDANPDLVFVEREMRAES